MSDIYLTIIIGVEMRQHKGWNLDYKCMHHRKVWWETSGNQSIDISWYKNR